MKGVSLPYFNFSIGNKTAKSLDIYIDGYIVDAATQEMYKEWWGDNTSVSCKSVREEISNSNPEVVNIYINSGGGQVIDAMAMHDMIVELQNKGVTVNCEGRGIVASAATYILMASKNSKMTENSWFMIHNVSGAIWGDVNDIEKYANMMRKFNNQIRDLYKNYTGATEKQVEDWMNAETWFTGKEAKEHKFVTDTTAKVEFSNAIKPEQWRFSNSQVLNAYNSFVKPNNQSDMDIKKITEAIETGFNNLFTKIGLANKTEDKDTKTAITEFSNSLVNAIKDAVPSEESIQEMVNKALTGEGLANAVTEGLKNALADKGVINEAIANATKDLAKTADVMTNDAWKVIEKDIADKLGNKAKKGDKPVDDKGAFNHDEVGFED